MAEGTTGLYAGAITEEKKRNFWMDLLTRLIREKPLGTVGAAIVLILLLVGIFAHWIAPYGYNDTWVGGRLDASSAEHWMGTDQSGRDLLSRIVYGAQISMYVGLGVSALSTVISALIGLISGFLGGKIDIIIQRFVDAWMCFPGIFIMITLMALVGPGIAQVIIVLGLLYGITGSRTVRGAVIGIRENVYIEAARSIGCPTGSLIIRHILPNVMAPMIIVFTSRMGAAILAEALRHPGAVPQLGRYAQSWTPIYARGDAISRMARFVPEYRRLGDKHVRGCPERPAGPETEGRTGALLGSKEEITETADEGLDTGSGKLKTSNAT